MMLKILRDRLVRLGRDEDGVALVVTLGVFMFLYVTCASVYAVGMAVKEKMHLQGACDAAAYSAAIVQADTFSRIATINRAMSWTYQQMTRRQMDYIVWQWLEEVVKHYKDDCDAASQYAYDHNYCSDTAEGKCLRAAPCYGKEKGWGCSDISLEGSLPGPYTEAQLRTLIAGFSDWLQKTNAASFYSRSATLSGLGLQIDDDLKNIYEMSAVIDDLAMGLPQRIKNATSAILDANIPAYMKSGDCQYFIDQCPNPLGSETGYFRSFKNTSYDEQILISYDNSEVKSTRAIFKSGIDEWFVRGDGKAQDGGEGIHRSYDHDRPGPPLRAHWEWWATGWNCGTIGPYHWRIPNGFKTYCNHSHDKCSCSRSGVPFSESCITNVTATTVTRTDGSTDTIYTPHSMSLDVGQKMNAQCSADNDRRYDDRYKGIVYITGEGRKPVYAKPLKLNRKYFGPAGTITVGLARRNENPWFSIFGRVTGGIYSAFSPVSNSWTYCFASAKAGYKLYHEPEDWYINAHLGSKNRTWKLDDWEEKLNGNIRVYSGPRDYCIDWKPEESKFAGWYWEDKDRDEGGRFARGENGDLIEDTPFKSKRRIGDNLVTEWTGVDELHPTWRQSWNLVQDDWDAVMVPVRQAGSRAREVANYSLLEWWRQRLSGQYSNVSDIPDRYEPAWQNRDSDYLGLLVNNANWQTLSGGSVPGTGAPDTGMTAGPTHGDRGDVMNGRLAGDIWEDHWRRGNPPPTATGTSLWNIESPGANLKWNQIGDEMYH